MKRKVLVIGAGGIGSFLIPLLDKVKLYDITVADPDKVETKNLPYQNFHVGHVGHNKAGVMEDIHESVLKDIRFPILTEKQMQGYDLVICCVDNLGLRKTLYNTKIKWLDLRAQGRNGAVVSHKADIKMYESLLSGGEGSFSCQGDSWNGTNEGVQFMQVVVAGLGAQWIQKYFIDEEVYDFKVVNG